MLNTIQSQAKARMEKTIRALEDELSRLRAGRAHPNLLDGVMVDYYGSQVPLTQVANIHVESGLMLTVKPWETKLTPVIEKAIRAADLGLNPIGATGMIRVPLPPLSEERRKELIKKVKNECEEGKVAIRNIRRDALQEAKELLKKKQISEDEERGGEEKIQKLTDQFTKNIDEIFVKKEKDLLEI
jgi:ribosome recycling factor